VPPYPGFFGWRGVKLKKRKAEKNHSQNTTKKESGFIVGPQNFKGKKGAYKKLSAGWGKKKRETREKKGLGKEGCPISDFSKKCGGKKGPHWGKSSN